MADGSFHAKHDRFAIADAAAGAGPAGVVPAGPTPALIAACPSCGALFVDLLAIRSAIRDARTPSRPRDFLLTAADAARLRPARWRRLLAIGTQRDAITRPIAASCTALGLAGLLLTTTVPFPSLGAASSAQSAASAAPPEIYISGEPVQPPVAEDKRVRDPVATTPLTGISIGLLVAGGVVFAARRIVPRLNRVR